MKTLMQFGIFHHSVLCSVDDDDEQEQEHEEEEEDEDFVLFCDYKFVC